MCFSPHPHTQGKNRRSERYAVRKKENPKIEAQRIGFNLERRSDGVSERWRLFGTKKRRRERYEVRDDVVRLMRFERTTFRVGV